MPFVKGMPRPAGAGRRKGSPQKRRPKDMPEIGYTSQSTGPRISVGTTVMGRGVTARLRELGCDPIEGMARLAMDTNNTPELRGRMFSELAQYEYPKLKSIEHTGSVATDESTTHRESLRARIAGIAARARMESVN